MGEPDPHTRYIFNGDFVDRGAWGLETLLLLAAWRLAAASTPTHPPTVTLLRGNHESATCTAVYGFRAELIAKLGARDGAAAYRSARAVFARLPLAALVADTTLVLHGGLFRSPLPRGGWAAGKRAHPGAPSPAAARRAAARRVAAADTTLGSIADLRAGVQGRD